MTPDEIREKTVALARSFVSLHADPKDPDSYHRYIQLIAPGEKPEVQKEMALMSGCGLVVAGIWRALGVESPHLDPPYKIGSAISRLMQIASEARAWVPFAEGRLPSPGDAVRVGGGAGGVEHIYTVVSVSKGDVITLASVDGGQRDEHRDEAIYAKTRVWKKGRDIVYQGSDPGAAAGEGRVIDGWVDITKLPIAGIARSAAEPPPAQVTQAATGGPARLSPAITQVTAAEMVASLRKAWTAQLGGVPGDRSLFVLVAQWALETGWGKAMHAYNVGNIKSVDGDGRDYTYFACDEVIGGKIVWFYPDAPGCRFRAYRTLDDGVADYLATIHQRYAKAWSAVVEGDPAAYAHLLKQERYYTASEESYAKGLTSIVEELERATPHATISGIDLYTTLGVQQALKRLGFDPGTLDGKNGPHTEAAVAAFQRAHALAADGVVGPATRKALADALSNPSQPQARS